ncbi:MAG TPA: PQQ-binding-like beta-propeller repeat protein [Verrucomicrobiae bacterium]|nr:PQQ-binding-like beta-propeller repeat protein [Verrucomicrobiae bacterium]
MIEITCSCGGTLEVLNEEVAKGVHCPRCGALASDLLAQAEQPDAVEEAGPTETEEPRFQVFCVNHPEEYATQNCMNCAKPLCMICVREKGYYCSDECRAAVSASEPSMATGTERVSADDNKFESVIGGVVKITKFALLAAVIFGVGYIGYIIYLSKWGPHPRITSSMDVMAGIDGFKVVMVDPAHTLVQAEDELSLVNLTTTQKLWKVDLHALEEPYSLPKKASSDSEFSFDSSKFRDPLSILEVKGDSVILRSRRQLVVLNAQTGAVAWKFFRPDTSLLQVLPHDDGLLCVFGHNMSAGKTAPPHAASLALADGHELWSDTNALAYAAAVPIPGKRIVTAVLDTPKKTASSDSDYGEITASGWDVNAFRSAMFSRIQNAMEKGSFDLETTADGPETEPDTPSQNYTVRFRSLETGTETGHQTVSLKHTPQIQQIDRFTCLVAGRDLLVFENGNEPLWQSTLPASVRLVAAGGDVFAVAAGDQVIALDAKTGKQKWSRAKLKPTRLVVGPDGGVYATVTLSKPDFTQNEAKSFRIEDTSTDGTTDPRAPVTFLMKLDPQKGSTSWGVRNIGGEVVFIKDKAYVFDTVVEMRLLSDTGPQVTYHSIHCLSPRNGKEIWTYIKTGDVHEHVILGDSVFLIVTEGSVLGSREHPSYNYRLCMLERK